MVSLAQAYACGLTRHQVAGRLARGSWERSHPGVYRLAGVSQTEYSELLAAVLAAGEGAVRR